MLWNLKMIVVLVGIEVMETVTKEWSKETGRTWNFGKSKNHLDIANNPEV